jgi:hypothetical protein
LAASKATMVIEILCNNCYGVIGFSEEFKRQYHAATGRVLNAHAPETRVDPLVINMVKYHGSAWSSSKYSHLIIRRIPHIFLGYWYIENYHGVERVKIEKSRMLMDMMEAYITHPAVSEEQRQYDLLKRYYELRYAFDEFDAY